MIAEYMDGSKKQVGERDPIFPPVPKSPYASAAYVHDCMEALYELIDASIGSALMLLPESKRNAIWSRFNALNALIKDDGMELNDEHAGV